MLSLGSSRAFQLGSFKSEPDQKKGRDDTKRTTKILLYQHTQEMYDNKWTFTKKTLQKNPTIELPIRIPGFIQVYLIPLK